MKHIVRKIYWDFEKEENWLNELAKKGMSLNDYSWCRYVFEETTPGEYSYRIVMLDNFANHPESIAYIKFIEETGAECVATYKRWVYFRKKATDGEFTIYSDLDSKMKHLRRISNIWFTLSFAELIIGLSNILIGLFNIMNGNEFGGFNFGLGTSLTCVGAVIFVFLYLPIHKKMNKLKKEKQIRE